MLAPTALTKRSRVAVPTSRPTHTVAIFIIMLSLYAANYRPPC